MARPTKGSGFRFSPRSRSNLDGVHIDLAIVVTLGLVWSPVDFVVIEGLRTKDRQREMVRIGASETLNSRHLTGHAIDIAAWVDGDVRWEGVYYKRIKPAIFSAGDYFGIPLTWGGDWQARDYGHFELSWDAYGKTD